MIIHLTNVILQMGGLEAVLTGIRDEFPSIRRFRFHREILTLVVCGSAFLFALQNITNVSTENANIYTHAVVVYELHLSGPFGNHWA